MSTPAPSSPASAPEAQEPAVSTHRATLVALVVGAGVVGVVAMAASASTLAALGHAVGWVQWEGRMAWSLPVSVDALALVAGVAWMARGVSVKTRTLAKGMTFLTVAASVVLNALGHLVESGDVVVGPPLRIAVSAVPPLVAALTVHLVVTALTDRPTPASEGQDVPVSEPEEKPVPAAVSAEPAPVSAARSVPAQEWSETVRGIVSTRFPEWEDAVSAPAKAVSARQETPVSAAVGAQGEDWTVPGDYAPAPVSAPTRKTVSAAVSAPAKAVSATVSEKTEEPVSERPADAHDGPRRAKVSAVEADRIVRECWAHGLPQRVAVERTGWSAGWVAKRYKEHRAERERAVAREQERSQQELPLAG